MARNGPGLRRRRRTLADIETPEVLADIERMADLGVSKHDIATLLGIPDDLIAGNKSKIVTETIERGRCKGNEKVISMLRKKCEEGDRQAIFFYLRSRAGWRDRNLDVNVQSLDGTGVAFIPERKTLDAWGEVVSQAKAIADSADIKDAEVL